MYCESTQEQLAKKGQELQDKQRCQYLPLNLQEGCVAPTKEGGGSDGVSNLSKIVSFNLDDYGNQCRSVTGRQRLDCHSEHTAV